MAQQSDINGNPIPDDLDWSKALPPTGATMKPPTAGAATQQYDINGSPIPTGLNWNAAPVSSSPTPVLKRNTGYSWSDPLKQVGVGALQGVGSLVSGIGSFGQMVARPIVAGVNAVAGQPVLQRPVNAFKPAGDWISGVGSKLEGTESQAAQQANAQPVVTGNVLSPSSWRLGAGASHPASWVQGAANLVGQALPMLAGGVEAKGLNLAPELVSKIASGEALTAAETAAVNTAAKVAARRTLGTGAAIGGLQGAQGSADSEQQRIMAMTPAQLAQLPGYQSRISQGMSPQDAQSDLAQATAANTFAATLPISTAAGAASALPFVHGAQEALTKAAGRSVLKRIGAGAAIEAPVQGAIGAGQQMAQNAASNATTGAQTPITDNTLAAFGGGALAGGLFGAAGAVLHRGLPGSLTDAADTIHAAETVAPGSTDAGAGAPAGAPVSPENASATATPAQSGQSTARVDPGQPPWDANDIGDAGQPSRDTLVSALASHMLAQHAATGDMRIDTQAIAKAWGVPQSQVVQARSRANRLANEMYADQVKAKVAASLQAKADAERDEALSAANEDSNSTSAARAEDAASPIVQSDTAANSDTSASESTQTPLKPGQPLHPWTPIDDSVSVPYAGGVSDNGQTIYLDKRMPKTVDVDGTPVDAQQAVALHERTEWPLMHLSGPMSDGDLNDLAQRVGLKSADELPPQVRSDLAAGKSLDYAPAHELATQAENQWVRTQYGVDPAKYQSALTDAIGKARTEAPDSADVPKDLDSKPYQNEGETDLVSGGKPTLTGAETRGEDQPPPDETEKVPKTETPPTGGVSRSGEQAAARTTPARREVGTTELDRREIPQHNAMRPAEALSHTLYRDTGAESAVEMLDGMPSHSGPGVHSVFAASHEHLAKGQGGNHGVMLKLDPHGFDGRFNLKKPAARELIQRNGEAEIEITPKTGAKSGDAVLSVTLHKGWKKGQSKGYVNRLLMNLREREQNGWTRVDTPEGIEFHAPGVESGADRRAQEAGPPKKSEPPAQADQTPPKGGVSASGKSKEPTQKPSPHVETARKLLGADVGDTAKPVHQATAVADEAHQATSASNTKDAGEELWANRRNSTGKGIQWHDIAELNDTLKSREAVKSKVWPRPNYAELVDGGMPAPIAHVIKQVYDAISVKPHTSVPTDQHYQDYIGAVNKIRDATFAWAKHVMEDGGALDEKTRADIQGIADKGGMDPKHAAAIVSALKLATKREYPILDAVMPMPAMEDGRNVSRFRTGEQGKANNALAHLLGGNKLAAALQINADSLRDADKATGKGWPASKEAWEKTFTIHESKAGEKVYRGGKTEILTEPEFWVSRRNGSRYRSIVADGFKTREDAVAAAKDAYAKTRQSGGDGAKAEVPVELQDARKGVPRRAANEDVDSEKLRETFGFKGINFGNWMKGDSAKNIAERQAHLNHAYDAFHDLADVMGLPPKAMSLDGTLGLAVGAQGKGGKNAAAAHFIPGVNEINLTREQGAGSLAHEWAHALDHYFATQVGGRIAASSHPFLSEHLNDANDGVRPEIRRAFKTIVDNMTTRPETDQEMADRLSRYQNRGRDGVEQVLKQARAQIEDSAKGDKAAALEQFDDLAKRLRTGDVGEGYVKTGKGRLDSAPQVVGQVANLVKEATGRKPDWTEALGSYARMVNSAKAAKSDNADRAMRVKSDYAKEARKLEGSRKTAYWSSHLEMFARAFQSYVLDKLADEGAQNHYLTRPQMTPEQRAALLADPMGKMLVEAGDRYPRGAERAAINKAFDTLVGDLKTETSENGNVRLFSLDDQGDPVTGRQARTFEEARKAADDFVGKPIKNDHGLVPATVSKTTLAKMLSNSATQKSSSPADHLRAVANVDALYRNGMLDETGKDKRGEPTIAAIHRVVAPMVGVNGDVVAVKMTVKETTHPDSPNPLYTVETLETEKPALYAPQGEVEPAPGQNRNAGQAGFSPEVTRMLEDFKNRLTAGKQDFDMRGARATTSADRGNPAEAAHTARVQSVVDQLTSQWRGSDLPRVHVRDTAEALPEDMKRNAAGEPDNAYKRARGAYDGKNIWIVAAKHDDTAEGRAQLASTLAHEAIGHYGIDRVVTRELGEGAWKHITDNITRIEHEKTGGKDIQSVLADVRRRYGASANATTMARETLAVMAERGMRNGLLDRAVAAVRAFLRRIMPSMSLKDIDLRRLLAKSSDYLERGETPREKVQSRAAMAFSRDGWREDFPNVVTAHQPGFVREHADYTAAKAGDAVAAARLARDAVTPEFVAKVRNSLPDDAHDLVVVPVHARESTGDNKIPAAAADVLARKLGADVNDHIVQAEKVGRGTGDAVHRLANQPTFTGDVQPGRDYVLLDDTLTQGGTLAQLKTHIEREGGRVVLATALTGKDYSRKLALDPDTLGNVRDRFGRIEGWWKRRFGYGFEGLTESEARAMLTLDHGKLSPDQLRDRIIARGIPELSHVDEGPAGARPGTEATGTAGRLTDTDAFRQFFGDSKVVDETGEPLTVYHGTADDFSTFDKSKGMEATGHATAPLGHFFTPDRALAERYAENASDGRPADQRVIDAHLRIENPYEMSLKEAQAIRTPEQAEALRTKLQHEGYDGIHIPESKTWVAFDSRQVKSASENHGTFDPANPNIYYSLDDSGQKDEGEAQRRPFGRAAESVEALHQQLPKLDRSAFQRVKDWVAGKVRDLEPYALGALQLRHLLELAGEEKVLASPAKAYADTFQRLDGDRNRMTEVGAGKVQELQKWAYERGPAGWRGKMKPEAQRLFKFMHAVTQIAVDPTNAYERLLMRDSRGEQMPWTEDLRKERIQALKDQMRGRSGDDKTAMEDEINDLKALPGRERARQEKYPELVAQWNSFSPEAKQQFTTMRDHYREMSEQLQEATLARIDALDIPKQNKLAIKALITKNFEDAQVGGVYFPLMRFGNYWIAGHRADGEYVFAKYENAAAAADAEKRMLAGGYSIEAKGRQDADYKAKQAPSGTFIHALMDTLRKAGAPEKTQDDIYQMYLKTLPELSMRKRGIHRKNIAGYTDNVPRAFASSVFHGAHQVSKARYGYQLQGLMDHMTELLDARRTTMSVPEAAHADALLGELRKRNDWIMNPSNSRLATMLTSIGFAYHLSASPAAAIVNLLQVPQIVLPVLGAHHGWPTAMKVLGASMRDAIRTAGNIDRVLHGEELMAFKALREQGTFQRTATHTLAGVAEGDELKSNPAWTKLMNAVGWMFHTSEVINREGTGMAAYRLARAKGQSFEQAIRYADEITNGTHGDYSNANRARYMQGNVGKIALQFKNYSLAMSWLWGRQFYKAFKGETPEVRAAARRVLTGLTGMTGLLAGAMGLPMINALRYGAQAVHAVTGDPNEPWDFNTEFRSWLDEHLGREAGSLVADGAASQLGANIASRVSMSDLWFRDADRQLEGADAYDNMLESLAGPLGGLIKNMYVGAQQYNEGHVWRGIETMMPTAPKNAMKAMRFASQGDNTLQGEPIVDDISTPEALIQAIGFQPTKVADQQKVNSALLNYSHFVQDRRQSLINAYALAHNAGDEEGQADALRSIRDFNQKYPEVAVRMSTIHDSLRTRARRVAQAENGVVLQRRLAGRIRQDVGAMAAPN